MENTFLRRLFRLKRYRGSDHSSSKPSASYVTDLHTSHTPDTSYGTHDTPDTRYKPPLGSAPDTSYEPPLDFGSDPDLTSYELSTYTPLNTSNYPHIHDTLYPSYSQRTYATPGLGYDLLRYYLGARYTSDVKPEIGQTLYAIVEVSGLPVDYHRQQLACEIRAGPRYFTYATVANHDGWNIKDALGYDQFTWHLLPKALIDELETMAWPYILGQGVLVRDVSKHTALMSLAEAAIVQFSASAGLLECFLFIVDSSFHYFRRNEILKGYTIEAFNGIRKVTVKTLSIPVQGGGWVLGMQSDSRLEQDALEMLMWLQNIMNSTVEMQQKKDGIAIIKPLSTVKTTMVRVEQNMTRYMNLEQDTLAALHGATIDPDTYQTTVNNPKEASGCWREKIANGIVLDVQQLFHRSEQPLPYLQTKEQHPPEDCLFLTAGAMWSLFDNDLVQKCSCTFAHPVGLERAFCPSKTTARPTITLNDPSASVSRRHNNKLKEEWIQFRGKLGQWYVWHLETDASKTCDGQNCSGRLDDMLSTTTPCILGWHARMRSTISPMLNENNESSFVPQSIATRTSLSSGFQNADAMAFTPERITLGAQLGFAWHGLQASLAATVSWALTLFSVENSTEDLLEPLSCIVLLYCETRHVHLAMEAADLVEELCIHQLNRAGVQNKAIFQDNHTARQRLKTWQATTFRTDDGRALSGRQIVAKATRRLQEFYDRRSPLPNHAPVCWPFVDFLNGNQTYAKRLPENLPRNLQNLWRAYPVLIFATGEIENSLVARRENTVSRLRFYRQGGWVADQSHIEKLLREAWTPYPAGIDRQDEKIRVRRVKGKHDVFEIKHQPGVVNPIQIARCTQCAEVADGDVCVHYFS
ncbi:hypothetical protein X797_008359 [Metarhizium robertsii]|uniref:Uncharacterized protein n=1 Tax=Metarhizium robertsii TaxID=568076 RepID=A0A014NBP1_9HYPO|nr:hypothetical protein X797_008359 [Metarhizium robertsii]